MSVIKRFSCIMKDINRTDPLISFKISQINTSGFTHTGCVNIKSQSPLCIFNYTGQIIEFITELNTQSLSILAVNLDRGYFYTLFIHLIHASAHI